MFDDDENAAAAAAAAAADDDDDDTHQLYSTQNTTNATLMNVPEL